MAVRLIVDSTADLLPQQKEAVTVVPLTVRFGTEEFIDGVTITHKEFYEKLASAKESPTTSQATPADFDDVFAQVAGSGDSAVVLTLASRLSGTYQSACIAAEDYENIFVVESGSVAIGIGLLAQLALDMIHQGLDAKTIAQRLQEEKGNLRIVAVVDTLEYLKKGGRISATAAIAGGLLGIRPIISVEKGQIHTLDKARGAKQAFSVLNRQIQRSGGIDFRRPVLLGYTGTNPEAVEKYREESCKDWGNPNPDYTCIGSVIGTHAGPGAVAVAFFTK